MAGGFERRRGKGHTMRQRLERAGLTRGTKRTLELAAMGLVGSRGKLTDSTPYADVTGFKHSHDAGSIGGKLTDTGFKRSPGMTDAAQSRAAAVIAEDRIWQGDDHGKP